MPREMSYDKLKKNKMIDLQIPGLDVGTGDRRGRFRVSAETRDRRVGEARKEMIRDLGRRLLFDVLKARLEGRFSTAELHVAYLKGDEALARLRDSHSGQLLSPLVVQYIGHTQARDKEKTKSQLDRFVSWAGGPERATTSDLTSERLGKFLRQLTSERHHRGKPVSGATMNRYRAALGGFSTYLLNRKLITSHPIAFRALPKAHEGSQRMPEFSSVEYQSYFEHIGNLRPEFLPVFRLLFHTGADIGEVLSRKVRDCHFEREQPRIRYRRTKTNTLERLVPIPVDFVAELRGHIAEHSLGYNDDLFGMFLRSAIERAHQQARKNIGRPDLRIKDMRHIAAISWRKGGADIESVREWLGHATINQTIVYNRYAPDDAHDAPKVKAASNLLTQARNITPLRAIA